MYPVTTAFLDTVAKSHRAISRIDVCEPSGTVLWSSTGTLDGAVTEDSSRAVRRACGASFIDTTGALSPTDADDLLAPLGNELRFYRGVLYRSATATVSDAYTDVYDDIYGGGAGGTIVGYHDEWVPLGVLGIARPSVSSESGGVTVSVEGYDRAVRIQRARFTDTYTIAKGADLAAALDALLQSRWPDCPTLVSEVPTETLTHRAVYEPEADPWQAAQDLATAYGAELLFDETGVPRLRDIPSATTGDVVATYTRGETNVILTADRQLDSEKTYSGVIVRGESTSAAAPAYGEAWDDDPASPTYYLGKFGAVPYFKTSSHITTNAQALATAARLLPRFSGVLEDAEWDQVPNPALQAGDVVKIVDTRLGFDGTFSLDSVATPLRPSGSQHLVARSRRLRWE